MRTRRGSATVCRAVLIAVSALSIFVWLGASSLVADEGSLLQVSAESVVVTSESPATFTFVNAGAEQDVAVRVLPVDAPIALSCRIEGSPSAVCGPNDSIGDVPAGGVVTVEISLVAYPPAELAQFEVLLVGLGNGAVLKVSGETAGPDDPAALEPPASLAIESTVGDPTSDDCFDLAIAVPAGGVLALASGPSEIRELHLESGKCANDSAAGAHVAVGELPAGTWTAVFDTIPGLDGGEITVTITRLPDPAAVIPSSLTYRSVIQRDDCLALGIPAASTATSSAVAYGPDGVANVTIGSSACTTGATTNGLLVDVSELSDPGTWKVTVDPDQTGPQGAVELTINRTERMRYAAIVLAIGSVATSLVAMVLVSVYGKTKDRLLESRRVHKIAAAKLAAARALAGYLSEDPGWPDAQAVAIRDCKPDVKKAGQFKLDMGAHTNLLTRYLPVAATLELDGLGFGRGFKAAAEDTLFYSVESRHGEGLAEFERQCHEALLAMQRVANEADTMSTELAAALGELIDAVPMWDIEASLRKKIGKLNGMDLRATFADTTRRKGAAPPEVEPGVETATVEEVVLELAEAAKSAADKLSSGRGRYWTVNGAVGLVALLLAVASGLATQYWPEAAWGTNAHIWKAATWSIAATGTVQASRLLGAGLPPITIK